MSETSRAFSYLLWHTPAAVVGLLVIGASALLFFHLNMKLKQLGESSYMRFTLPITLVVRIPKTYLRRAALEGWSQWPAYTAWLCVASGIGFLASGRPSPLPKSRAKPRVRPGRATVQREEVEWGPQLSHCPTCAKFLSSPLLTSFPLISSFQSGNKVPKPGTIAPFIVLL